MRRHHIVVIALLVGLPSAVEAQKPAAPTDGPTLERVGWLAGCWRMSVSGITIEEQWMAPRGGTMVGMNRTVRGGATVGYEYLLISREDSVLVYAADPTRQAPTEFRSTAVRQGLATFENPQHDFPRRIMYRRIAPDSLIAQIDDGAGGNMRQFRFRRAACGR
jgi:hypothetical protein